MLTELYITPGKAHQNKEDSVNSEFFTIAKNGNNITLTFNDSCTSIDAKNFSSIEKDAIIVMNENTDMQSLIFDLSNITYLSSAGLRMFSAIHNAAQESHIDYELVGCSKDIKEMFLLTGYSSIFTIN